MVRVIEGTNTESISPKEVLKALKEVASDKAFETLGSAVIRCYDITRNLKRALRIIAQDVSSIKSIEQDLDNTLYSGIMLRIIRLLHDIHSRFTDIDELRIALIKSLADRYMVMITVRRSKPVFIVIDLGTFTEILNVVKGDIEALISKLETNTGSYDLAVVASYVLNEFLNSVNDECLAIWSLSYRLNAVSNILNDLHVNKVIETSDIRIHLVGDSVVDSLIALALSAMLKGMDIEGVRRLTKEAVSNARFIDVARSVVTVTDDSRTIGCSAYDPRVCIEVREVPEHTFRGEARGLAGATCAILGVPPEIGNVAEAIAPNYGCDENAGIVVCSVPGAVLVAVGERYRVEGIPLSIYDCYPARSAIIGVAAARAVLKPGIGREVDRDSLERLANRIREFLDRYEPILSSPVVRALRSFLSEVERERVPS